MKKILMLGGAHSQIPAIKAAKKMGHYVIICDYLDDNPGRNYADEYYNISIVDKDAVLHLAKSIQIDGIVSYESEAGAPTAAFVAEKLGLPSHPYKSVEILSNKDLFKEFLKENNFNVPKAKGYDSIETAKADFHHYKMPVMVKPVDSSGSRGISKIDTIELLQEKAEYALSFSRARRFIVEEYIEKSGYQVGGDGFSVNGKLVFRSFSNEHFPSTPINPFVPIGSSWPCNMPAHIQNKIHDEIQMVLNLLKMGTGAYNFDVLVDDRENVYILEIAARNGGDWLPQVIKYVTGIDMISYTIMAALGENCNDLTLVDPEGFWSCYVVNSHENGLFKGVVFDDELLKHNLVEYEMQVDTGAPIFAFTGANNKLGTMILKFSSKGEMLDKMDNMSKWVKLNVEHSVLKSISR